MRAFVLLAALLALGACDQAQLAAARFAHPAADKYCANVPQELRLRTRVAVGTTPSGNQIAVHCVGDITPEPRPS